jgi:hypothetical protein
MSLVTPSGGLVYHLRALRSANTLWAPFRGALADWLARSLPLANELILIGPSAGHCLPLERFRSLERVLVLEPDPVARWMLARRLAHCRVAVESRDVLVEPLLRGQQGLSPLLERWPSAPVLFCNVLGQLHFALSEAQHERFRQAFRERLLPLLAGRRWASFHDRWSLDWREGTQWLPASREFPRLPSDAELAEAWFGPGSEPVTALDHGTTALFPESLPRSYFGWQLTPTALHVVEALSSG